jgi:hypothetical protein
MFGYRGRKVSQNLFITICNKSFYYVTMIVVMTLGLMISSGKTLAYAAGTTVEIRAQVMPVREVMVNRQHRITKIISNTDKNIEPSVWLDSGGLHKEAMTAYISDQYSAVLKSLPGQKDHGVIYSIRKLQLWQQVGVLIIRKLPITDVRALHLNSLF